MAKIAIAAEDCIISIEINVKSRNIGDRSCV